MQAPVHPPGYVDGRLHFDERHRVLVTDFDVADYTRRARPRIVVDPTPIHLDPVTHQDLEYLWRVEASALGEMRSMLASWTGRESRITAFLATWAYERYRIAKALADVLRADGCPGPTIPRRQLVGAAHALYVEHLLPTVASLATIVVREPVTAGHMARMAVHEGAMDVAHRALRPRLPEHLRPVIDQILERRADFLAFFRAEAAARIRRSTAERLIARARLVGWVPLRPDGVPDPDERRAIRSILGTEATVEAARASDTHVGELLPGRPAPTVATVERLTRSRPGERH